MTVLAATDRPSALGLADAQCRVAVLEHAADIDAIAGPWDALALRVGAGVQQTWTWLRTWWSVYRGARSLRVITLHVDDTLVGIVPLVIDTICLGPLSIRLARLAGTDHTQALGDLTVEPSWIDAAVAAARRVALEDERCDALVLGPLSSADGRVEAVAAAAHRPDVVGRVMRDRVRGAHMTLELPATFEAWLSMRSKRVRYDLRAGASRLERLGPISVEVIDDPASEPGALDEFIAMHQAQWRANGMPGHFRDWPSAEMFHRRLADALAPRGGFHLMRLRVGDNIVAQHLNHLHGDRCHWLLTARRTGSAWREFGLGKLCFMHLIAEIIPRGIRTLDACVGDYDYKKKLGAVQHPVRTLTLAADRTIARWRAAGFLHLADALDLAYYRVWYGRLAPRLHVRSRGLNESWMRSRV